MTRLFACFLALAAADAAVGVRAQAPPNSSISPAHNWALDLFTDSGFRSMTLRGDEVHSLGEERIQVADLSIIVFTADASSQVTTILLSPSASFDTKEGKAAGSQGVHLIRDDAEVFGRVWTFYRAGEKISIRGDVRVVLKAPFGDMLQ